MFAVLKTGGKQYKVVKDQILEIEKLDTIAGELIQFNEILILSSKETLIGDPLVSNAAVKAEVIKQKKDKKVISFFKRRRKHSSKRTKGHRQNKTVIRITEIIENSSYVDLDRKLNNGIFVLKKTSKRSTDKISKKVKDETNNEKITKDGRKNDSLKKINKKISLKEGKSSVSSKKKDVKTKTTEKNLKKD